MKILNQEVKRFMYEDGYWLITFIHDEHEQEVMANTLTKTIELMGRILK